MTRTVRTEAMTKRLTIFAIMGTLYMAIEVTYNAILSNAWSLIGHSSLWMFPVGGALSVALGEIKRRFPGIVRPLQVLLGATAITAIELLSGLFLNKLLGLDIWDYSKSNINFVGQIDLVHSTCWILISPLVFWMDEAIDHYIFGDQKPDSFFTYYIKAFLP